MTETAYSIAGRMIVDPATGIPTLDFIAAWDDLIGEGSSAIAQGIISSAGALIAANDLDDVADVATARGNLGVDAAGTDNSTPVTIAGQGYLSLNGQLITAGQIDLSAHVTGNLPAGSVSGLATVATTGAYADVTGTPTLATVATSGDYTDLSNTPAAVALLYTGTGTPESAVTAAVGSLFLRTDGGTGTTLYVKETGAGNTGWVAK